MNRKRVVAANWKMNFGTAEALEFVRAIRYGLSNVAGVESLIFPPFLAVPAVAEALSGSKIGVGAQNLHHEESGAYTGETSASMVAEHCSHVLVGHSERRELFGESEESVNRKVLAAVAAGLVPVICVGESLEIKEAGGTGVTVRSQVKNAFAGLSSDEARSTLVAYEPVWAIGSGLAATAAVAGSTIGVHIRGQLAELFGEETAQAIPVLYGGSVKPGNIAEYVAHPDIDGALVGGASLKKSYVELVANAG